MKKSSISYKRHRFPQQIIAHAVWLYFRFPLSLRLVEELLLERGIIVSYETMRRWGRKFGPAYAKQLRRRQPSRQDVWHLDEVVVSIAGRKHWLWRAVDQDGYVLDEIVQSRRDTRAARRLLRRLLKKQGMPPKRIITDKLRSYSAAKRDLMPTVEHRSHKGLNNRAENSHLPLRKREHQMQGFRSAGGNDLLRHPKSLRRTASQPLCSRHSHSSCPRHGALENSDGCHCLILGSRAVVRSPLDNVTTPLREFLDVKRQSGPGAAIAHAAGRPTAIPAIVSGIWGDKTERFRTRNADALIGLGGDGALRYLLQPPGNARTA